MARVKRDYVEPLDDSELLESAIRGMVKDLDAHSQYLDADEYRDIRISTTGSYTGIGVEVAEIDGAIKVVTPITGSPAARCAQTCSAKACIPVTPRAWCLPASG